MRPEYGVFVNLTGMGFKWPSREATTTQILAEAKPDSGAPGDGVRRQQAQKMSGPKWPAQGSKLLLIRSHTNDHMLAVRRYISMNSMFKSS